MKTVIRSLAWAGILVATMPAHADEIIKTNRYSVDGSPLSIGHVAVEDAPLRQQIKITREESALVETGPVVETQAAVVQDGKLAQTRTTIVTSTGRGIKSTAVIERICNDHNQVMVQEFAAIIEATQPGNTEPAPDTHPEQRKTYWPLFDYSVFDDRIISLGG